MKNIKNTHITKLPFVLTIAVLIAGQLSCSQIESLLDAEYSHPDTPIE